MKGFTFPTNKHNLNQSSSYFKDNKRIPYTHPKKHKQKRNRINKSQFYDINNSIIPISQGLYTHNPKQQTKKIKKDYHKSMIHKNHLYEKNPRYYHRTQKTNTEP